MEPKRQQRVAPRVGAWIETLVDPQHVKELVVAPRVGAWIETSNGGLPEAMGKSRPVWARGLKPCSSKIQPKPIASRPVWARGLKPLICPVIVAPTGSRPVWARGLKRQRSRPPSWEQPSRPVWARGLKPRGISANNKSLRRAPCGRVD